MSDDLISRQDAIDALAYFEEKSPTGCTAQEVVKALPSARLTGRWIFETLDGTPGYRPTVMFCSKCGRVSIANYSYCPNCGLPMETEVEE